MPRDTNRIDDMFPLGMVPYVHDMDAALVDVWARSETKYEMEMRATRHLQGPFTTCSIASATATVANSDETSSYPCSRTMC